MTKKEGWNPEQLRSTAEEIRGAVMPKSITPEMVGGTLLGILDSLTTLESRNRMVGVYPFDGVCADVEMLDECFEGQTMWDRGRACFMECTDMDGGVWTNAGEDYCEQGHNGGAIPLTDRLYRSGGSLYRVRGTEAEGFELVRLVDEGDTTAVRTELRREIVGLWDETAKIQAKLADLYSTETANLLRRLGYEQEDIDEYRWAVSHLDLFISLDQLRNSVKAWEGEGRFCAMTVAPKWTAEMEAGELTPLEMRREKFNYAKYFPHITTGRGFWADSNSELADYYAGLHATAPCGIDRLAVCRGLGSFTGQITTFTLRNNIYLLDCFKKLKSDIPISMFRALPNQYNIDFANIDVANATDLEDFSSVDFVGGFGYECSLPKGFFDTDKGVRMNNALGCRRFVGESFDFEGRASVAYNVFCRWGYSAGVYHDWGSSAVFDDCDINLSPGEDEAESNSLPFSHFGYFIVPANKKSRIKAHGLPRIYPCALISPYMDEGVERMYCGVWEVDCPDVEDIRPDYCWPETSATFWNLGSNLRTRTLLLREMMKSYQFGYQQDNFYGFMAANDILRESFKASLRSWVSPPEACSIVLYKEQYDVLSEDDVAALTEKGYSVVVDNSYNLTSVAQYKFN